MRNPEFRERRHSLDLTLLSQSCTLIYPYFLVDFLSKNHSPQRDSFPFIYFVLKVQFQSLIIFCYERIGDANPAVERSAGTTLDVGGFHSGVGMTEPYFFISLYCSLSRFN